MYTSWPRAIDSRAALCASAAAPLPRGSAVHLPSIGKTQRLVLLPSTPASPLSSARGPKALGPLSSMRLPACLSFCCAMYTWLSNATMPSNCCRVSGASRCRCTAAASAACARSEGARASAIRFMLVGLPVSGSRAVGKPFLPMNEDTPKFWCVGYLRLAAGRGLRYTDTMGCAELKPYCGCRLQPVGSRTTSMLNSGSMRLPAASCGGQGRNTRNRPRLSSSECEAGSCCGRCGQLAPSTAAKIGSWPCVTCHCCRMLSSDRLMASCG